MRDKQASFLAAVLVWTGCVAAGAPAIAADKTQIEGEAALKIAGAHVWRGEIVSDDPVFQPSIFLDFDPFAFSLWGSWELEHSADYAQRSRVNATVDHLHESGEHIFRSGLTAFIYQNSSRHALKNTVEIFFAYTLGRTLMPTLAAHYDIGHFNGLYLLASGSHRFELIADAMALDLRVGVGWGDQRYARDTFSLPRYTRDEPDFEPTGAAFLDMTFRAELPLRFSERFKVVPGFAYMRMLNSDIRQALDNAGLDADNASGSLSLILEF